MQKRYTRWRSPWPERAGAAIAVLFLFAAPVLAENYDAGRKAYLEGDYARALDILEPLATDGNSDAQKLMGVMYDYGHGVERDPRAALKWYLQSAKQGDPDVQYHVGAKYFRGDGTGQNYQEAARWWEQAANGGQVDAQFNLGVMYFRGVSVAQDDNRAAELFVKAADQGHSRAQYSLAVMYTYGRGVEKNERTALELFRKSADQGEALAQYHLGTLYEEGRGVERNLATARTWYERAAAQGLDEARGKLSRMDDSDIASPIGHPDEITAAAAAPTSTRVYDPQEDGPGARRPAAPALPPDMPAAAAPTASAPAPAQAGPASATPPADNELRRETWVLAQDPGSFTLQLGSVTSEKDMRRFLHDNGIEAEAGYVAVVIDGVTRYNALYGAYPTYSEAQQAAQALPSALHDVKPWIRNFGILQKLLQ